LNSVTATSKTTASKLRDTKPIRTSEPVQVAKVMNDEIQSTPNLCKWTEDEMSIPGFADIIHRYPCYDKENTTAGMWSYFKMLVKPDGQRNLICIPSARNQNMENDGTPKVTLLTRSKSSTASQQQHLRNKHKQMFEDLQTESLHSKASSVKVKKCKEDNAIALAEAVRTGTIDKFVEIFRVLRYDGIKGAGNINFED